MKRLLSAGAAAVAVAALGAGAPAHAQDASALQAQIQQLQAQLTALQAQVQAVQAQAQTAQAQAQTAQTQAQTAQAQVETIPTQVHTAVAAAAPKSAGSGTAWYDNTSISGRMYYNISSIDQDSDGKRVAPSGTGFDIKRFYVGIDHKFNNIFSANVTTDFQYSSAIGATEVYIKKAYLQATLNKAFTLRLGSADLPWVPYVEDIYGYRYVENTLIDRTKFGTSADWGVHALGTLPGGIVSYQVSVIDGSGYKAPLRSHAVDVEGRVSAKIDNINLAIGGYSGKLGKEVENGARTYHTADRFDALAAYVDKRLRVGFEYFYTKNWNNVLTVAEDTSDGYSAFASYAFTPQIGVFGRYDYVKPKRDTNSKNDGDYFNIGVSYEPVKIVDFALLYKRDSVDNGIIATSNGNIGGVRNGTYDEVGLWGQLRW